MTDAREKIIEELEGLCGTLHSVPYHQIETEDLLKILNTVNLYRKEAIRLREWIADKMEK